MNAQFIEIEGKQVVVIPADDYRILLEKAEMLDDVAAYDRAKAALASGDDELVPAVIVNAILDGKKPIAGLASASRDVSIAARRGGRYLSSVFSADRDREAGGNREPLSVVS